jgi:hypothetical protein
MKGVGPRSRLNCTTYYSAMVACEVPSSFLIIQVTLGLSVRTLVVTSGEGRADPYMNPKMRSPTFLTSYRSVCHLQSWRMEVSAVKVYFTY